MSLIEEKCKEKGVRLTDQKVIAKVLSESKKKFTGLKIIQT